MTRTRKSLVGTVATLALVASPAYADITCQDFNRAAILNDADVLAEAQEMIRPWFDATNEIHAILHPTDPPRVSSAMNLLGLAGLETACEALPSDTVGRIVATWMKGMERQKAQAIATMQKAPVVLPPPPPQPRPAIRPGETLALTDKEIGAIGDHVRTCLPEPHAGFGEYTTKEHLEALGWSPSTMEILARPMKLTTDVNGVVREAKPTASKHVQPEEQQIEQQAIKAFLDPRCSKLPLPTDTLGRVNVFTMPLTSVWFYQGY